MGDCIPARPLPRAGPKTFPSCPNAWGRDAPLPRLLLLKLNVSMLFRLLKLSLGLVLPLPLLPLLSLLSLLSSLLPLPLPPLLHFLLPLLVSPRLFNPLLPSLLLLLPLRDSNRAPLTPPPLTTPRLTNLPPPPIRSIGSWKATTRLARFHREAARKLPALLLPEKATSSGAPKE